MLFLGGWTLPLPATSAAGPSRSARLWLLLEGAVRSVFVQMWLRWTLPRLRVDQVMAHGLEVLLPISLALVVIVGGAGALP